MALPNPSSVICPHCGQTHRQGAKFCPNTGKLLEAAGASPVVAGVGQGQPSGSELPRASGHAQTSQAADHVVGVPAAAGRPGQTGKLPPDFLLANRYRIIRKVGEGGMAAVYQALDSQQMGSLWAIKELSNSALANEKERQYAKVAFQQEANILKTLNHPNLPKVIDAFVEEGRHYLVMGFVQGQTLQSLLEARKEPFAEAEVLPWAVQLCDVLNYLHNQTPKIIFRDLKPSNIMITSEGQARLIDFGIARFFKPEKTKDTLALGTPGYSAPEAAGGQTDERSDIYSLCVTLHQLLSLNDPGRTLFNFPLVRKLNPRISLGMEQALARGLQNQRDLRWKNAADLRSEFSRILSKTPSAPEPAGSKPALVTASTQRAMAGDSAPLRPAAPPARKQPPIMATKVAGRPAPPKARSARPTTRLLMAAAQLSGWQFALLGFLLLLVLVGGAWLLTPYLAEAPVEWNNVPIIAIFGAFGFAAHPKRGIAFLSHGMLSSALVATIWSRAEGGFLWEYYGPLNLILGSIISGLVMEVWVAFLPRLKDAPQRLVWLREAVWIALMAVIGTALFFLIVTSFDSGYNPLQWLLSAILGIVGWFLGDLIQQYLVYKRTGIWRER